MIVSSFQLSTLLAVQAADGRLPLGALWPFAAKTVEALGVAVEAGFRAIHPFVTEVNPALIESAHRAGLAVNVWTVNATHDLVAFVEMGVDAVITDRLVDAIAIARAGGA